LTVDLDGTKITVFVTFLPALMIQFAINFIPTASFLAQILFVVRIVFDMTQFRALMPTIETCVARPWAESCFGIVATSDFNLVAATG
jgi:hypothetical protein